MFDFTGRKAKIKRQAEDMALELIGNGLQTTDPAMVPLCEKLRPFQEKLGRVDRNLVRMGLNMVSVNLNGDDNEEAKRCLHELVTKLEGMAPMLGITL